MISSDKLFRIAVDYYINGRSQQDIAKDFSVSHVQVGKYLRLARERGIVEISINPPYIDIDEKNRYERVLRESYGLENLVLVPGAHSEKNSFQFLIDGARDYLLRTYPNKSLRLGFGMGRTISELSSSKVRTSEKRTQWKVLPVRNYALSMDPTFFRYDDVADNFVSNWGVSRGDEGAGLNLDVVIGGVGVPFSREPSVRAAAFGKDVAEKMAGCDILGDYLNNFFDRNGAIYQLADRPSTAFPWDELQKVPHRIAVASGYQKISSITGLLKCGAANTLVTDLPTVKAVVENLL